jgi:signal transduction histidine kinase
VKGDPSGLRQVFMNLLVNAHQAIEGDGVIDVATEKYDDDTVSIAIRDSGCGMEENIIERIWEPFFTTKEVGTGTGLGLAITYNIIKEHGGEIRLVSRVGEGSEFTVLLPVWQG